MPIPQLQKRKTQTWRNQRKKHKPARKTSSRKSFKRKERKIRNLKKKLFSIAITLFLVVVIFVFLFVAWLSRNIPNPNQLINREVAQSTKIYDRTGENILYEIHGEEKRTLVSLEDIPDYVKEAAIAIEDKNFYKHSGISLWAMFRTLITNVLRNERAGGSTLTQQFIKNAVLTPEKRISRKIKEIVLAQRLEKKFSKDEILQMYLNEIPYGSNAYGVEAASQKYFGKSVQDISLAEAAVLAALPQAPSRYSPYGPNKDLLLGRKNYVLDLMEEQGYITDEERKTSQEEEIKFRGPETNITAPHFVMYIKNILSEKYGEKMIEQEGLKIYTTLDLYKQEIAEEVIAEKTEKYEENFNASNVSLVTIDPKTGQILAMIGSRDYFDDEIDGQVNVSTRPRQPGSSMKPIVYAALFEKGYTPDTVLYDVVTNFSTDPDEPYEPHNYDGNENGPVSIRKALAGSLNIPAVKAIYLANINNVLDLADNLGYTTLYPRNRFGLSLVLGGGEVKLLEHVNAYSAFARDGYVSPIVGILKVEDKDGKVIEEYKESREKVITPQVARMINSILSDNDARTFAFGENNPLTLGDRPVAAKTGTTNDYHDAWTIGYTPSIVTGVWVGNSNNDKMVDGAGGSTLAGPIWHDFMKKVLGDTPIEVFKEPDEYKTGKAILDGEMPLELVKIDSSSGLLANELTPLELIIERMAPVHHNILFYVDKENPTGKNPENPSLDSQFDLWEEAIQTWSGENATSSLELPEDYDRFHNEENKPTLKILSPNKNETINKSELKIKIKANAPRSIGRVEYYINNNIWGTKWGEPGEFSKDISFLNNGFHSLRVKACDDIENCSESSINFNLLIKDNHITTDKNSIQMVEPSNGLALNTIDFPLQIKLLINNPERTAKIDIVIETSEKIEVVRRIIPTEKSITINWGSPPTSGTYLFYARLHDWNGDVLESNKINLTVN